MNPKRRRRSYRRNGVLPISWNPAMAGGDIMSRMKSMIDLDFWTETAAPVSVGFFGSKIIGAQVYGLVFSSGTTPLASYVPLAALPFVKAAVNAVSGAAMAWGAEKFVSKKVGDNVWVGTIVGVASDLIRTLLLAYAPTVAASMGLSGLGADLTEAMKQNIAKRIQGGVAGLGTYLTRERLQNNLAEYVTDRALRNNAAYAPGPGGSLRSDLADYDHTNSETSF
jgi:hypothetical protein